MYPNAKHVKEIPKTRKICYMPDQLIKWTGLSIIVDQVRKGLNVGKVLYTWYLNKINLPLSIPFSWHWLIFPNNLYYKNENIPRGIKKHWQSRYIICSQQYQVKLTFKCPWFLLLSSNLTHILGQTKSNIYLHQMIIK